MANGLLHARFHAIGNQHHVKDLSLACLVNFFQAASGPYTIAGAFQPFQSQAAGQVRLPRSIAAQQGEHVVPFGGNFRVTNVIKLTLNGFLELEQHYRRY